ncbi:hypothetical protein BC936DRAFT_141053 [Jimgerdemannia flammicorona]|uniref:Uncharacterized protein n=1 Tax=Jimgerdemannia flammicorona TaxID=994334 RepID=A0A433A2Z0_9FUNG|nr:hypothetical protein BC936DRAFT_141053 [Jimgerdemannia flammicorona]
MAGARVGALSHMQIHSTSSGCWHAVRDAEIVYDIISEHDDRDPTSMPIDISRIRIHNRRSRGSDGPSYRHPTGEYQYTTSKLPFDVFPFQFRSSESGGIPAIMVPFGASPLDGYPVWL